MSEKIIMKTWREMEDLLEIAQPGDMIEFNRGYYSHWGIFIGDAKIIHRYGENDGIGHSIGLRGNITTLFGVEFNKASIEKSELSIVISYGGKARVNNYRDREQTPLPVEIILERAERALGQQGYNLIYSNCEHFATDCRYGQSNSAQVQTVVGTLATGLFITALMGTGAYLIHRSSRTKDEERKKLK